MSKFDVVGFGHLLNNLNILKLRLFKMTLKVGYNLGFVSGGSKELSIFEHREDKIQDIPYNEDLHYLFSLLMFNFAHEAFPVFETKKDLINTVR